MTEQPSISIDNFKEQQSPYHHEQYGVVLPDNKGLLVVQKELEEDEQYVALLFDHENEEVGDFFVSHAVLETCKQDALAEYSDFCND